MLHEVEKASYHLKNSEKDVRDLMARSGKPKTLNNRFTNPHSTFVYCPRISKNKLTKEGQNMRENAKTDLKPFYTISEPSMRAMLLDSTLSFANGTLRS